MRNYRRANRKRAYYDSMSDSRTPMSQSELAAEAEAVFEIVFDEDPNALSQSGAIGKIFDHFKRYGISNDYSDAVDMIIYIEENLKQSNRKTANRPNEQQKKDFINPARELTSVDYGEFHDGSYYMSFGLGGVPNAIMVRIGDDELERVLEGLGHYYSFSADGYSFYLSFPKWEIWDHNGNGGFTISDEAMTVVHDGLFEIFLNDGMPHTSSRRVANADHAEAVDFVFSSFDKDMEEFSWWYYNDYDGLYANVEKILSRGFTGGPFDIDKIIVDVVNGKSRFSKRRANRKRAYKDDIDLLLGFLDGDMDSDTFGQLSSPGQNLDRLLLDILDSYEARNVKDLIDWYHGLASPVERDLSELSSQGAIDLSTIEGRMAELIEHNLSYQI